MSWLPSPFAERREVQGEVLDLIRISRTEMGAYLCIAQNGVPPSISKRIILTVECEYHQSTCQVIMNPRAFMLIMLFCWCQSSLSQRGKQCI